MKKTLLFISIICIYCTLSAQQFAPIGATWHYTEGFFGNGNIDFEKIESVKDTLIQNKLCKKLAKRHGFISMYAPMRDLFVYSNADTVFMFEPNIQNFQAIYIFSAPSNSSYSFLIHPNPMFSSPPYLLDTVQVTIDSIGSIIRNNQAVALQFVSYNVFLGNKAHGSYHSYQSTIYDGIGDSYYLTNFSAFRSLVIDGNYSGSIRCYQDPIQGLTQFTTDSCTHSSVWVGIDKTKRAEISVYPNPVENQLTINGIVEGEYNYQINDILGKRVSEGTLQKVINVSTFQKGIYILSVLNENGVLIDSKKFVKN